MKRHLIITILLLSALLFVATSCTEEIGITCDPITWECFDQYGNQIDIPNPEDYLPEGYAMPTEFTKNPVLTPPPGTYNVDELTIEITSPTQDATIYFAPNQAMVDDWMERAEELGEQITSGPECSTLFHILNDTVNDSITAIEDKLAGSVHRDTSGATEEAINTCTALIDELFSAEPDQLETIVLGITSEETDACLFVFDIIDELTEEELQKLIDQYESFDQEDIDSCEALFEDVQVLLDEDAQRLEYKGPFKLTGDAEIGVVAIKYGMYPSNFITALYNLDGDDPTNQPPVANFNLPTQDIYEGDSVTFTSASTDPDGLSDITGYAWYIDGNLQSAESFFSQTFDTDGTYKIKLVVTDSAQNTDIREKDLVVLPIIPDPWCSDTENPTSKWVKGTVSGYFTNGEVTPETDDSCCTNCNTVNAFAGEYLREYYCSGDYIAEDIVTCPNGCEDGVCKKVDLTVDFDYMPAQPVVGETMIFSIDSESLELPLADLEWEWSIDEGINPELDNLETWSYEFDGAGSHTVKLTVLCSENCNDEMYYETKQIFVRNSREIVANFEYSPLSPKVGETVVFISTSTGPIDEYEWSVDNVVVGDDESFSRAFASSGIYDVKLRVMKDNGEIVDEKTRSVTVAPFTGVLADFEFIPSSPKKGDAVTFTSTSTGSVDEFEWKIDGAVVSAQESFWEVFDDAGIYDVTLTVIDTANSDSDTITKTVIVTESIVNPIVANFEFVPSEPKEGDQVTFMSTSTGPYTNLRWEIDGSYESSQENFTKIFDTPGDYVIKLTAYQENQLQNIGGVRNDEIVRTITVVEDDIDEVVADFEYLPSNPEKGDIVTFTSTSTGLIELYIWEIDGVEVHRGQIGTFRKEFSEAGVYQVKLTVLDEDAINVDFITKTVTVTESIVNPIVADFEFVPSEPKEGDAVTFTSTSTGSVDEFEWKIDGAVVSAQESFWEVFDDAGIYDVTLTVIDTANSDYDSITRTVTVDEGDPIGLNANFEYIPAEPEVGETVLFTSTSTGDIDDYEWIVDEQSISTSSNYSRIFSEAREYLITLKITNGATGQSDEETKTVTVFPGGVDEVVANFQHLPLNPIVNQEVIFSSTSSGEINSFEWRINDLLQSTSNWFSYTFDTPAEYSVKLKVIGDNNEDEIERTVRVDIETPLSCDTGEDCASGLICVAGTCSENCLNGEMCSDSIDNYDDYGVCTYDGENNLCDRREAAQHPESLVLFGGCTYALGILPEDSICTDKNLAGGFIPLGHCDATGNCIISSIAQDCDSVADCNTGELCVDGTCTTGCTEADMRNNIMCSDDVTNNYDADGICIYAGSGILPVEDQCGEVAAYDGEFYATCGLKNSVNGTICDTNTAGGFADDGTCCGTSCILAGSIPLAGTCCSNLDCQSGNCVSGTCQATPYSGGGGGGSYTGGECNSVWQCSKYGLCQKEGKQYRTCWDVNECGKTIDAPAVSQDCTYIQRTVSTSFSSPYVPQATNTKTQTPPPSYQQGGQANPNLNNGIEPAGNTQTNTQTNPNIGANTGEIPSSEGLDIWLLVAIVVVVLVVIAIVVVLTKKKNP